MTAQTALLSSVLERAARERGVPGASLALWHDNQLSVATTGVLNIETGEAVQRDSMFQTGSITKPVTTTVIMRLVDDGRIDLDAAVRTYIPTFRLADLQASKDITVRQLLNHTSGLGGDFMTDTGAGPDKLKRYVDCCALLPLSHAVGKGFSYSNSAFGIAGRIVEVVTGLEFDAALKKLVLEPLGLKNSFSDPADLVGRSVASGHSPDPDEPAKSKRIATLFTLPLSGAPAGSTLMMSAGDLVSFARMHLADGVSQDGTKVLSTESVAAMREETVRVPVPQRDIAAWGLGWFIVEAKGGTYFGHDGGTVGQTSFLRIHKETGTIAVLFVNGGAANDLMKDVFSEVLDPLTGITPTAMPEAVTDTSLDLSKYEGVYERVGSTSRFWVEDGKLMFESKLRLDDVIIPEPPCALTYAGDNHFTFVRPPATSPGLVSFLDPDANGKPQILFSGLRVANRVHGKT